MISFVATPIGNLKDITLRALETLKSADVIFCEDTRHTLKLLNAYDIKKPLFSCHKFNEREASERILQASRNGQTVAVVSDAGTPVVSDPGNIVCQTLKEAGEKYTLTTDTLFNKAGKFLVMGCNGKTFGCRIADDWPETYYVGFTACEGKNRFYDFTLSSTNELSEAMKERFTA